eukprot:jgi/Botrbrau1/15719/Bobra.4_1s0089.2
MVSRLAAEPHCMPQSQEWCRANDAECVAVQLPGRGLRSKEVPLRSCQEVAQELLPVVASRLQSAPYVIIAHSVGTWCAYEFVMLARDEGLPLPRHLFLSAMAAPAWAPDARPWRQQANLSEAQFKEECRGWDVNEVVFSEALWPVYHSLMRADFTLFDSYQYHHQGKPPFDIPITSFFGTRDRRISREMVEAWRSFTRAPFECLPCEGHHLWPADKVAKAVWLDAIVTRLSRLPLSQPGSSPGGKE